MRSHPPPLKDVLSLYAGHDEMPHLAHARLRSPSTEGDAARVLGYLAGFGLRPTTLDQLRAAIDELEGEEELSAHPVAEGLAVTHASDGWWVLFTA
jgi:hypothetical protein